jgi:hypothetical protein
MGHDKGTTCGPVSWPLKLAGVLVSLFHDILGTTADNPQVQHCPRSVLQRGLLLPLHILS